MAQGNNPETIARAFENDEKFFRDQSVDPKTFRADPDHLFIAGTFPGKLSKFPNGWKDSSKGGYEAGEHYAHIYFGPVLRKRSIFEEVEHLDELARVEMKKTEKGYDPYFVNTKIDTDEDSVRIYFWQGGEEIILRDITSPRMGHTVGWIYSPNNQITAYTFGTDAEIYWHLHLNSIKNPLDIKDYPFGKGISVDTVRESSHTISSTPELDDPLALRINTEIVRRGDKEYLQFVQDAKVFPDTRLFMDEEKQLLLPRRQLILARVPIVRPQQDPEDPESMKGQLFTSRFLRNPVTASLSDDSRWRTPDLAGLTGVRELIVD